MAKPAIFPPPVPGDSRWKIPYGGLVLSVVVAAWRREQWLIARGPTAVGRPRPVLPSVVLSHGEPPVRGARRLLRSLGLRPGAPILVGASSRRARRGHWDVAFVFAAPVMGRTQKTRHAEEPDFRDARDPAVASAFRAAGISLTEVERRLAAERRRGRARGPLGAHDDGTDAAGTAAAGRAPAAGASVGATDVATASTGGAAAPGSPPRGLALAETRDVAALRAFLAHDPIAHCYLLGDLEPPYFSATRFFVARKAGAITALVARYEFDEIPTVLAAGDSGGVLELLRNPYRPLAARFHFFEEHAEAVGALYDLPHLERMLRMGLDRDRFRPAAAAAEPVPLAEADAEEVHRLYAGWERRYFGAQAVRVSLRRGPWFGIRDAGRLVAVAGTHALNLRDRVAAIGGVFTHPEHRGRGLASTLVTALLGRLIEHADRIGLNVVEGNEPAITAFSRLGFAVHNRFVEGTGTRRTSGARPP